MIGFYNGKTLNPTDFESKKRKLPLKKNQNVIVCQ